MGFHFVTVTGVDELANCAALVGSISRLCPGSPVTVFVCVDDVTGVRIEGAQVRSASELEVDELTTLATGYRDRTLGRVLAGRAIASCLDQSERVIFIEPQLTLINAPPPALLDSNDSGVTVFPAAPSGQRSAHPGALAVRRGEAGSKVIDAWPKAELGKPIDFPEWFEQEVASAGGTIWSDRPVGRIVRDADGEGEDEQAEAAGSPIAFDWGDLDPENPNSFLIGHVRSSAGPGLSTLLRDFQEDSRALASADAQPPASTFADGTPISPTLGRLAIEAIGSGLVDSPFEDLQSWTDFVGWLNEPASFEDDAGLTRYHEALWQDSEELQDAYPEPSGKDADGYAGWLCVHAPERLSLPEALLPPRPASLDGYAAESDATGPAGLVPLETPETTEPLWGVNVAGFLTSELGLGEATRLLIAGLDAAAVPCMPVQGELLPPSRQEAAFAFVGPDSAPFPVNVVCINGDGIPEFAREAGRDFFEDRYTIALWWWETDEIPESWEAAFDWIDEVWVASELVAQAVRKRSPVPVTKIVLPVTVPARSLPGKAELGFPDAFNFYFSFDYHSTTARKNPVGVIEAFKRAFELGSGPHLNIKSINAEKRPWDHAEVLNAAGDRPDIHFIDRYVTAEERDGLMAACDCYVSLHRSEGLGLTPAEALWFGRPVIATAYGGVMEFLTEENSYLVVSKDTYVGPNADPYPPDGRWQEPDLDQAAQLMRRVFERQDEAAGKGRAGARDVRESHSLQAAGASMRSRLEEIFAELPERKRPVVSTLPPVDDHAVSERLETQPEPRGGLAARTARKALRKVEAQDRERQLGTDRELLGLIRRVDERLRATAHELERSQLAEKAEALSLFRAIETQTQEISAQLSELLHLLAEHRSLPYVAEDFEFEEWLDSSSGRVQGFRANEAVDGSIVGMADAFRGTEEHVRKLQEPYVNLLEGAGPVLDIGCGRGELLDLLSAAGIEATGVDLDREMVARAEAKGHTVQAGDALEHLAGLDDASLGAIFSAQLVEHLPFDQLERLFALATAKLRPGGLFVAETVNPHCVNAMKAFWVDPTHQHPLFPETMLQLARSAGFGSAYVFHPNASGDVDRDRYGSPAYALVATAAG